MTKLRSLGHQSRQIHHLHAENFHQKRYHYAYESGLLLHDMEDSERNVFFQAVFSYAHILAKSIVFFQLRSKGKFWEALGRVIA